MSEKKWFALLIILLISLGVLIFIAFTINNSRSVVKPSRKDDLLFWLDDKLLLSKRVENTAFLLEDAKRQFDKMSSNEKKVRRRAMLIFELAADQLKGRHDECPIAGYWFDREMPDSSGEKKGE